MLSETYYLHFFVVKGLRLTDLLANYFQLCKSMRKNMIEVCCAIIMKGSSMLAVQRGPESSHPGKWEFPGGKIDPFETAEQCIVREIEEELSVRLEIIQRLSSVEFCYKEADQFCLIPFASKIISGEITRSEHIAERWLSLDEWDTLDWLDADRKLIVKNLQQLKLQLLKNIG